MPAGAACPIHPGAGPGIPFRRDAAPALQTGLAAIEDGAAQADAALERVLAAARREDGFTLWHLLARTSGTGRTRVCDRLAMLVPLPQGVSRQGILDGDTRMLDLWWNSLGLGNTGWWRLETLKQARWEGNKSRPSSSDASGYNYILQALQARGNDPEMEFAAAKAGSWPIRQADYEEHLRKAAAGADSNPLLAANLHSHFHFAPAGTAKIAKIPDRRK